MHSVFWNQFVQRLYILKKYLRKSRPEKINLKDTCETNFDTSINDLDKILAFFNKKIKLNSADFFLLIYPKLNNIIIKNALDSGVLV